VHAHSRNLLIGIVSAAILTVGQLAAGETGAVKPTAKDLKQVTDYLAWRNAHCDITVDPESGEKIYTYYAHTSTTDADVISYPIIPFTFNLVFQGRISSYAVRQLAKQPNLRGLTLYDVNDDHLEELAEFKNLQFLVCGDGLTGRKKISNAGLRFVGQLRSLRRLEFGAGKVTGEALKHLASLENLEELTLRCPNVVDHLGDLAPLKKLRRLDLSSTGITNDALTHLAEFPSLELLHLGFTSDLALRDGVKHLPHLRELHCGGTRMTDDGFKELTGLKELSDFEIFDTSMGDKGAKHIGEIESLKRLAIWSNPAYGLTDEGVKTLANLKNLTELSVESKRITDASTAELAKLRQLESLDLSLTGVTATGLADLRSLTRLHRLHLHWREITDEALHVLRKNGQLYTLDLATAENEARPASAADVVAVDLTTSMITDDGLKELADFKNRRELRLNYRSANSRAFGKRGSCTVLKDFAFLEYLDLTQTEVDDDWLDGIQELKRLSVLRLHNTNVTDRGLAAVARLSSLRELQLPAKATDKGLEHIRKLPCLENLDLFKTAITDDGLACLRDLSELRHLSLWSTAITCAGLRHLKNVEKLESLDLSSCESLTDACLVGVKELNSLRSLGLNDVKVTASGIEVLSQMTNLQGLYLEGTGITDKELVRLKSLTKLEFLGVTHTRISDKGVRYLQRQLPRCCIFTSYPLSP
jgi:Leucine-rich repeat (LRR) protein